MAGISDAAALLMIDWLTATGTPTRPTAFYLALFTTNPNFQTGAGGTEASGGSYARIALTMETAATRATQNSSGPHEFVVGTNLAAGTYTGFGIYSLSAAGVFLGGATFSASRTVSVSGDKIAFAVGAIDFTLPNS